MQTKTFEPGEKVTLITKSKEWTGHVLESHDVNIILLKLESGYNIGIRESEILDAKVIKKTSKIRKKEFIEDQKRSLPNIAMIITGGTISSRLDPKTGGVISTDVRDILNVAPELKDIANIVSIESPIMKFSGDMDPGDWKTIAETVLPHLINQEIDGIILTHGTDTLSYTAAALSFFTQNLNKPIAVTFSQKSIDRGSTDASLNLICAAKYATSDIAEVCLIGHEDTNDETCIAIPATKARKMHTSKRGTFKAINSKPLARITKDNFKILDEFNAKDLLRIPKIDIKFENKIAIVKIYPGANPDIIDYYESKGYKGLVLEVTGLGHVPSNNSKNNWIAKIKKIISNGMTVVAATTTLNGRINMNVYSYGRDLKKTGIISMKDALPETSFVKLGYVLGHKNWNAKEKLEENLKREFSDSIDL
ncbi:MAG: Glu-tRNA(Gln) amidotransferase subunit GatD [Nanoarchaeota archaeon]|nr:Glu-tRNA(Gln) amidotransferase subunit GatD [Nanoarchaeota archaeon]